MISKWFLRIQNTTPISRRHKLAGVVTVEGVPASRLVVVFDRGTLTRVSSVQSSRIDGKWEISGLKEYPEKSLIVIAIDPTGGTHNAKIADFVSQIGPPAPPVEETVTE